MQNKKDFPSSSSPLWGTVFPAKASKGDKKKLEIVESAIELFSKNGIESVSYDNLAERLKTNRSHITYHFKERRDLYLACFRYLMAMGQDFTVARMRETPDRAELFRSYLQGYFGFFDANPQLRVLMLFYNYFASIDPETGELYREMTQVGWQRIREILREMYELANKKVPKDLDLQTTSIQKLIVGSLLTNLALGRSPLHFGTEINSALSNEIKGDEKIQPGIPILLDAIHRITKL